MLDFSNVQTRDGRKVSIISTSGWGEYPILGYIGVNHAIQQWTTSGHYLTACKCANEDLVPIPKEITKRWLVVLLTAWNMPFYYADPFNSEEEANQCAAGYEHAKVIALHDLFKE